MKTGILGGTFNPVHLGHLLAARQALESLGLDRILFIPCSRPALKSTGGLLPAPLRLKLLKLAVKGEQGFEVDDRELRRGGVSYTVETLRELRAEHPGEQFHFLLGSDALKDFPLWRESA